MITGFKRIIRAGFVGFWRNAFVSFSAIFVMMVTLVTIGAAMLLGVLLDTSLAQIKNKVDINVYTVVTAEEEDIFLLKESLEALPDVAEVTYMSRDEALTEFRERYKNDDLTIQALEELGENPLRATLSIRAKDTTQYEEIASFLNEKQLSEDAEKPLIDKVNFFDNKVAIDKLTSIIDAVERSSFIAMVVLLIASVLITFNTIRLTIYTTRDEIAIMRLVGAGNMFIRGPFMLQGIMYGFVAAILTLLLIYPAVLWLGPVTGDFFLLNIFEYYVSNFGYLFSVISGSGIVLGMISSMLAVARYLRV